MTSRALRKELRFFEANRERYLKRHRGEYVLIKGERTVKFVKSAEAAYQEGVKRYGRPPFLIKLVAAQDPPVCIPVLSTGIPPNASP